MMAFSPKELLELRAKQKAENKGLPHLGKLKERAPHPTIDVSKELAAHLDSVKCAVGSTSIEKIGNLSQGDWIPEKQVVKVLSTKGKRVLNHTYYVNGECLLMPESAVFLMETGALEVFHHGLSLTIQEAYEIILHTVPMSHYFVFSYLSRMGYIVLRHDRSRGMPPESTKTEELEKPSGEPKLTRKRTASTLSSTVFEAKKRRGQKSGVLGSSNTAVKGDSSGTKDTCDDTVLMHGDNESINPFLSDRQNLVREKSTELDVNVDNRVQLGVPKTASKQCADEVDWNAFRQFSCGSADSVGDNVSPGKNRNDVTRTECRQNLLQQMQDVHSALGSSELFQFAWRSSSGSRCVHGRPKSWQEAKRSISSWSGFYDNPADGLEPLMDPSFHFDSSPEANECLTQMLSISQEEAETCNALKNTASTDSTLKPVYDVYAPTSKFKKTDPGPPAHRVIVTSFHAKPPTLYELLAASDSTSDTDIVPMHWAVVDNGDVVFYEICAGVSIPTLPHR